MKHLSRITVAIVSLFASGALLAQSTPPKPAAKPGKPRHIHVGDIFNSGRSIREIMEIFNINQAQVIDYLHEYLLAGFDLRSSAA